MTVEMYLETVNTKMKGGLFSLVVLHMIATRGPIHGYAIGKDLLEVSGGRIDIKAGTMYPILKVLENHGLVEHRVVSTSEGPPRKVYRTTKAGQVAEEEGRRLLEEMVEGVGLTMGNGGPPLRVWR